MICTQCGEPMDQTDKNSFSGRVIREYLCRKCGHSDWEDDGVALWQALEDLQEKHEAEAAAQAAASAEPPQPDLQQSIWKPPSSFWQRLIGHFRKRK